MKFPKSYWLLLLMVLALTACVSTAEARGRFRQRLFFRGNCGPYGCSPARIPSPAKPKTEPKKPYVAPTPKANEPLSPP